MRVLLTCGIGDFIAIESHLTARERFGVHAIHWATRAREALQTLTPFVFPNVEEHVVERDTWGPAFGPEFSVASRAELPDLDPSVVDWSVGGIAAEVRTGDRHYTGSRLMRSLCEVRDLPQRYAVVHPYSENCRTRVRDLNHAEWFRAHAYASALGLSVVIVNRGIDRLPDLPNVIDLTNELSLPEAIEITKRASAFFGAASAFSVIAAKAIPANRLFIKGSADLRENYHRFYYAPHETNAFIAESLLQIIPHA